jgi:hypothetical protein
MYQLEIDKHLPVRAQTTTAASYFESNTMPIPTAQAQACHKQASLLIKTLQSSPNNKSILSGIQSTSIISTPS